MNLPGGPGATGERETQRDRRRPRLAAASAVGVLAALVAAGCGGDDSPGRSAPASSIDVNPVAEVHITDSGIDPGGLVIGPGEAVGVTNDGTKDHRLTSAQYDTGVLRPGESTLLFGSQIGRFELKGDTGSVTALVITVEPGTGSSGTPAGRG